MFPGTMCNASGTGRATQTFVVWDLKENKAYFLNNPWRSKESDIIRKLAKEKMPNIPQLIISGDNLEVPDQITQRHSLSRKNRVSDRSRQQRHRLVEDFIPKSVEQFTTGRHMMEVMYGALLAHQAAYVNCGILHRDINNNNIMIDDNGRGILADWELATHVRDAHSRRCYRTGTWAFMSWRLSSSHVHGLLRDDLESIFYVVLYLILHHFPVDLGIYIPRLIRNLFKKADWDDVLQRFTGGVHKVSLSVSGQLLDLKIPGCRPIEIWIQNIAPVLFRQVPPHPEFGNEDPQVENHKYFAGMFKDVIASGEWIEEGKRPTKRKVRTGKDI